MAFDTNPSYSGPIVHGDEASPATGNAAYLQHGTEASRPAAGNDGVMYLATDTGKLFYDDGTIWQELNANNHVHQITEQDNAGEQDAQGATARDIDLVLVSGESNTSDTVAVSPTTDAIIAGFASYAMDDSFTEWSAEIEIDGVQAAAVSGQINKEHRLNSFSGSRQVSSGSKTVVATIHNDEVGFSHELLIVANAMAFGVAAV